MGSRSGWKGGNLKVPWGLGSRPEAELMARREGGDECGVWNVDYAIRRKVVLAGVSERVAQV